ncbi:MAG: hypothetical protein K2H52_04285 [Lachnospiraceae bacterium]|nr:hypothetical protein [Lachnospiraceae bacterium]MDE6185269.1 hypothetical protein [Lachnospiraceae bacterium]
MNIFLLFIICIIAWGLIRLQDKYVIIEKVLGFFSCATLLLSIVAFFTGYDLVKSAWTDLKSLWSTSPESVYSSTPLYESTLPPTAPPAPLQVVLPDSIPEGTPASDMAEGSKSSLVCETAIYNIGNRVNRNSDDKIHIEWLPLANQDNYKLRIEADDPFLDAETEREYTCEDNWCDVDVSDFPNGTLLFAAVAVWDPEANEWIYSEPISFTLR